MPPPLQLGAKSRLRIIAEIVVAPVEAMLAQAEHEMKPKIDEGTGSYLGPPVGRRICSFIDRGAARTTRRAERHPTRCSMAVAANVD